MDPIIMGAAILAKNFLEPKLEKLQKKLQPDYQSVETQAKLNNEEASLLNQLRQGGPCVICGSKGTHVALAHLRKDIKTVKSGFLFRKKIVSFYDKRTVAAPLCSKHYLEAKNSPIKCFAVYLIWILATTIFSGSMLWLKQRGYCNCIMPDGDVETVILWFVIGFVGFAFLIATLGFWSDKRINFKTLVNFGPLKRLRELDWAIWVDPQCHR